MATKSIAWNTGNGNITLTYQGQGNGAITVESDDNNGAARSQVITVETLDGTKSVNLTVSQAACPVPVGNVLNFAYTGSFQEVELPAGEYKLQCWGAQGGSNDTNSTYGITAQAGGKGGYSEGVITLTQKTTLRVYVGGQGSASAGGFNGGGSTAGTAQYNSGNEFGYSKMGGGGGATDIRLSDGALLSRMIVAGGGSGGAYCYKKVTTEVTGWRSLGTYTLLAQTGSNAYAHRTNDLSVGQTIRVTDVSLNKRPTSDISEFYIAYRNSSGGWVDYDVLTINEAYTIRSVVSGQLIDLMVEINGTVSNGELALWSMDEQYTYEDTSTSSDSQTGYAGGGTTGAGYSSTYQGKQNAAGSGGSFGQGANQGTSNYRFCSGAGGGGWYGGGGGSYSDSSMTYCKYSGGGSGFVNTASSASYRPSGYTGLQLDSGTTYAGSSSFPSTGGGTETGHSGNGYARITRLS